MRTDPDWRPTRWRVALLVIAALLVGCGRLGYEASRLDAGATGTHDAAGGNSADASALARDATWDAPVTMTPGTDARTRDARAAMDAPAVAQDAAPDADTAVPDAGPAACDPAIFWELDFDADPTALDVNGDAVPDWARRGGMPFPVAALEDGIWNASPGIDLDTRPFNPFNTRTLVDVRLESLGQPERFGAVFWVNVNTDSPDAFSVVAASLAQTADGNQSLSLYGKVGDAHTLLAEVPGLRPGLLHVRLDIDVRARNVGLWIADAHHGTHPYPVTGEPKDPFATLLAWPGSGGARFDYVRIVRCAP